MTLIQELARLALWPALALDLLASSYLLLMVIASRLPSPRPKPDKNRPWTRFAVIVPAHNEELLLGSTLTSLRSQDYPVERYQVHVIADNCTDGTASVARGMGVIVHERSDSEHRGKGQALRWLLDKLDSSAIDALVFVDADTIVDTNFLASMHSYIAEGQVALQASYRVQDPGSSPLVGFRALAFALVHDLRGRAKARLGVSSGLWGNGMVLTVDCLKAVPWQSYSIVEDAEQHLSMVLRGIKVRFVPETHVYGYMPSGLGDATVQQQRWEGGRLSLIRLYASRLLNDVVRHTRFSSAPVLLELFLPPLSVWVLASLAIVIWALLAGGSLALVLALGCGLMLVTYVACGALIVRLPLRAYSGLLYAPFYIAWKAWLFANELRGHRERAWSRTSRNG